MTGGNVSRSMSADVRAARRDRNAQAKRFEIRRQTKAGKDSKMASDSLRFRDLGQALSHIKYLQEINPTLDLTYRIYNI